MGNTIEEYKKQFRPETLELIVRIRWSWERGCSAFSMIENYYKAEIQFDRALNVKTGEVIEFGINRVEWLAPKKMFGFKYGYKFKRGNMYRILVREYIPKGNEKFRKYYLEQVLEKDINEPRLDSLYNFESTFEEEVTEMTVLIKQRINGWAIESKYRKPVAIFLASIDSKTNVLNRSYGRLTWMEKDSGLNIKFNFDDLRTYRVQVRKNKENNNYYLLLDVKKVRDDRFESIKEEYLKPVVINSKFGEFQLNKNYDRFEGVINYLGEKCDIYLNVEEGATTAEIQLNKLDEIFHNLTDWDKKVKEYAVDQLLGLANEWREDDTEITKEQFIQRIGVPSLYINEGGSVEVRFDSDEMFTDHGILVEIDENGEMNGATIEG